MPQRIKPGVQTKSPNPKPLPNSKGGTEKISRPQHYVYMEKGVTKNLDNYNSARITIGITVQVNPTEEELKAVSKTIKIVNNILDIEMDEQVKGLER